MTSPSSRIVTCEAILFDCDGVLVDSDASVAHAWTRWADRYGFAAGDVLPLVHGRRSVETVHLLIDESRRVEALRTVDRFELEDAARVTAIPGAAALITGLPRARWAVVTSAVTDLARARLAAARLPEPTVLITADDVPVGKPDPSGYLAAARILDVDPANAVVIEDSAAGVQAGRAAGVRTIVGVGERALATDADIVVADLRALSWNGTGLTVHGALRV